MARVVALVGLASAHLASSLNATPVQQVISMLTEMKSKGAAAMEDEKKIFTTYSNWVNDKTTELGFEIKTGQDQKGQLIAFIDKAENTIRTLSNEIAQLDQETNKLAAEKKAAAEQREDEHDEYLKTQQDYSESVEALEQAIQVLKAQNYDRPQAEALLQKMAAKMPGMPRVLAAFLQERQKQKDDGAPAVAAYESQTGGVIDLLENLLDRFKGELNDVETAEANSAHANDMQNLHLENTIRAMTADREERAARKGSEVAASGSAKGELAQTKADLADDQKLLAEVQATFATKSRQFKENQEVRSMELEAIGEAITIISNPNVAESYGKHIKLAQVTAKTVSPHGLNFLQEGSQTSSARAVARAHAVDFLRSRAKAVSSKVLEEAAASIEANPFGKVIDLIKNLLARLKEESAAEADHKAWCDGELKANKLKRNKVTATVGQLAAQVQEYGANIQGMAKELATLAEEQATLSQQMAERTGQRIKEKAENEATIKDAQEAQHALTQALVILREFYGNQAGPAFMQTKKQVPEMAAYKGMQGENKGIVGLLEVIMSDFSRLESETKANEHEAAEDFANLETTTKVSLEQKHKREVQLKLDKDQAEFEQSRVKKDLESAEAELKAANDYYDTLKPSCLEVHVSYEERVARRKEEIAALQEAYKMLDGDFNNPY